MQRLAIGLAMMSLVMAVTQAPAQSQPAPQLANPASLHCVGKGGMLRMERRPDGGQYGVCVFTDNYQCEEWAMFRGECPAGGLRVTGYITPAARYCAITGGRYTVVAKRVLPMSRAPAHCRAASRAPPMPTMPAPAAVD